MKRSLYAEWFGWTPEDRRRTWGLLGMTVVLSPFLVSLEVMRALRVPFLEKLR